MKIVHSNHVLLFVVCVLFVTSAVGQEINGNDVIRCGDINCSEPISRAAVLLQYTSDSEDKLTVERGKKKRIYGKIPGKKLFLLRDSKTRKFGFVPFIAIKEFFVIISNDKLINVSVADIFPHLAQVDKVVEKVAGGVAAEAGNQTPPPKPYDVFNGTTLVIDTNGDPIEPTRTQEPSLKTQDNIIDDEEDEDDEDGEEDDEEEEEEETEEDLEADESVEKQAIKLSLTATAEKQESATMKDVFPTTSDQIMSTKDFDSLLDSALNSEPGKDREMDEKILKSYAQNTEPLSTKNIDTTVQTLPSTVSNQSSIEAKQSEFSADPTVSDVPSKSAVIEDKTTFPDFPSKSTVNEDKITVSGSISENQGPDSVKKQPTPPMLGNIHLGPGAMPIVKPEVVKSAIETQLPSTEMDSVASVADTIHHNPQQELSTESTKEEKSADPVQVNQSLSNPAEIEPSYTTQYEQMEQPSISIELPSVPSTQIDPSTEQTNPVAPSIQNDSTPNQTETEGTEPETQQVPQIADNLETQQIAQITENQETQPVARIAENLETFEQSTDESADVDDGPGFFAAFTNPFAGLFGGPTDEIIEPNPEIIPEGECKSTAGLETSCDDAPTSQDILHFFDKTVPENSYVSVYLLSTSITVLLFLLGYYFLERTRQDGPLVAKVNQLTHELQVAKAQQDLNTIQDFQSNEISAALSDAQDEINTLKKIKTDLEAQLEAQQIELDATAEAGLEMNRMLSELLGQRNASDTLLTSVEHLQGQLNSQQQVIDGMNKSLTEKKQENEALQAELSAAHAKVENLEEELNDMRTNLNVHLKEKESAMWELEQTNLKLESDLVKVEEAKKREIDELIKSLTEFKEKLLVRDSEFRALKETIDDFKGNSVNIDALYDVGNVRAELVRSLAEKEELLEKFHEEEGARKLLEDHVKAIDHEVLSLRLSFETAEREKLEAETKLTVLSNYFKEKEVQLHKELGIQEAMWAQKQGDETTIIETIKSLRDEVDNYNYDSFCNSNEPISVTNSVSSLCTDAANLLSISPKLTEPFSSLNIDSPTIDPWDYPHCEKSENLSIRSLPIRTRPKSCILSRRKSSVEFEARLERAEMMTVMKPDPQPRPIPDDLLKLKELKTVRASPFRDTSVSPESNSNSIKCSELVDKFEKFQKPNILIDIEPVSPKRAPIDKSESEDSQATSKDSENTASSARVEFDIKVVANASANVKKFKKKTSWPKNGAQNETLKKEILDQERGLKTQISTLEKKAHENWVAARQAERRLEESKQEAGQLRNMLTLFEKSSVTDSEGKPVSREINGEDILPPFLTDGSSPLPLPPLPLDPSLLPPGFMPSFLPPLGGFIPPPPSHPGEHRPPPLGRMSSPPLARFSPAPGDFNFDRMSPRPPPVRSYRSPPIDNDRFHHPTSPWDDRSSFRPVANQRDSRNDYPDSNPSSRPSSAESLEKRPRRSKV